MFLPFMSYMFENQIMRNTQDNSLETLLAYLNRGVYMQPTISSLLSIFNFNSWCFVIIQQCQWKNVFHSASRSFSETLVRQRLIHFTLMGWLTPQWSSFACESGRMYVRLLSAELWVRHENETLLIRFLLSSECRSGRAPASRAWLMFGQSSTAQYSV